MRKVIDVIEELEKNGDLQLLHKSGVLPAKVLYYREIFNYVDSKVASGVHKTTAIIWAEETFQCSRRTVYHAISAFG